MRSKVILALFATVLSGTAVADDVASFQCPSLGFGCSVTCSRNGAAPQRLATSFGNIQIRHLQDKSLEIVVSKIDGQNAEKFFVLSEQYLCEVAGYESRR